jgi:hypothetical protein
LVKAQQRKGERREDEGHGSSARRDSKGNMEEMSQVE